jgi:uncharacterized membrane protein
MGKLLMTIIGFIIIISWLITTTIPTTRAIAKLERGGILTCTDGNKTFEISFNDGWRSGVIYFSNRDNKILIGNCK